MFVAKNLKDAAHNAYVKVNKMSIAAPKPLCLQVASMAKRAMLLLPRRFSGRLGLCYHPP